MFNKYVGMMMSLVYIFIGLAIIVKGATLFSIAPTYALPLGSMFIVYGLFRAYRVYQKHFQQ